MKYRSVVGRIYEVGKREPGKVYAACHSKSDTKFIQQQNKNIMKLSQISSLDDFYK